MSSILAQLEKPASGPVQVTIAGDAGMGKTTLAAAFPSPVIIRVEDGIAALGDNCPPVFPVADTSQMVMDQLNALGSEDHEFRTVIIDSVTKLERVIEAEVVAADGKAKSINQANGGYGAGFKAVAERHRQIKAVCDNLKRYVGMNVVYIAHVESETIDLPDQDQFMRYSLRMHRHSIAHYCDDVDVVAFIKQKTFTRGDGDKKKAITDGTRIITCYPTPSHISKNRFGIVDDLPFLKGTNPLAEFIPSLQPAQPQTEVA
ncbi:MAG: ATP-binding protein [Spongiibacteraceae bacterium]